MKGVNLVFASHDGHTRRLVDRLAARFQQEGLGVSVWDLDAAVLDEGLWEASNFTLVLSPIRYGHHLLAVDRFLARYKGCLMPSRLGLVSINLTARKTEKNTPSTNPYYKKWIKKHKITPYVGHVWAGKLDYSLYRWWERQVIRLIMKITGGPTDPSTVIDYTDYAQVDALATEIIRACQDWEAA